MPSISKKLTISTLTDVEFCSGIRVLADLGYVFFAWYHDVDYDSDEYGCTSLPNIFHRWLMKLDDLRAGKDTHINLGEECSNFVVLATAYVPQRKELWLGGYRYTGPDNGHPRLEIWDVSSPVSPVLKKALELSTSGDHPRVIPYVSTKHNVVILGILLDNTPQGRVCSIDEVFGANSLDELPSATPAPLWVYPLDEDSVTMAHDGARYKCTLPGYECTEISVSDIACACMVDVGDYYALMYSGDTNVMVDFYDKNLNLVKTIDTGISKASCSEYPIGKNKLLIISGTSWAIVDINGVVASGSLSLPCLQGSITPDGTIICSHKGTGEGSIYELVPDTHYKIVKDENGVKIVDKNGNPVANADVLVGEIKSSCQSWRSHALIFNAKHITRKTNSNGYIDLTDLYGKAIEIIAG